MNGAQASVPTIKGNACDSCRSAVQAAFYKNGESIPLWPNLSALQQSGHSKACDLCRLIYQHIIYNTPCLEDIEEPIRINWFCFDEGSTEALVVSTDGAWAFLSSEYPLEDEMVKGGILSQ